MIKCYESISHIPQNLHTNRIFSIFPSNTSSSVPIYLTRIRIEFLDMEENIPTLFTRIILRKDVDASILAGNVSLQIDEAYRIGKSVAVLYDEKVIGHVEKIATPTIWRFLRAGDDLTAQVYDGVGRWVNERWFSVLTYSFEIGIKIQFPRLNREDGKLLLAHITRGKLNSFPGVRTDNCPEDLMPLVEPTKDENGLTSLYFASTNAS